MANLKLTINPLRELNISKKAIEIYKLLCSYNTNSKQESNISLLKICEFANTSYEETKDYLIELSEYRLLDIITIYDEYTTEERYDYKIRDIF